MMAKILLILFATMALHACTTAAPNSEDLPEIKVLSENANPKLDGPSQASKLTDDSGPQGQRQKRFYDHLDFDFAPYLPYNHNYIKRDGSQNTAVYGTQDFMSQILKRVQTILSYTRQQALSPPVVHYPVPSFIPLYYIPRGVCDCTPVAPSNGEPGKSSTEAHPTQPTTSTPLADSTTQGISSANQPGTSSVEVDIDITTLGFPSRLPEMDDEEDGSRPISFNPVTPEKPLNRPPPPVEHGSSQASKINSMKGASPTTHRPVITGLPPLAHLPTNSIPTLCDGAVLTCCHRSDVTYKCFESQGCPNPASPDDPCKENIILKVIDKFQYYYANRRG